MADDTPTVALAPAPALAPTLAPTLTALPTTTAPTKYVRLTEADFHRLKSLALKAVEAERLAAGVAIVATVPTGSPATNQATVSGSPIQGTQDQAGGVHPGPAPAASPASASGPASATAPTSPANAAPTDQDVANILRPLAVQAAALGTTAPGAADPTAPSAAGLATATINDRLATITSLEELLASVELPAPLVYRPAVPRKADPNDPKYRQTTPYGALWSLVLQTCEMLGLDRAPRAQLPPDHRDYRPHQDERPAVPTALSPAAVDSILNAVERGISRKAAAAMMGFSERYFAHYLNWGRAGVEPYATLNDMFQLAEGRNEYMLVSRWEAQTQESWQAAQALLSKRFPEAWGDKRTLELSVAQLAEMSPHQLAQIIGPEAQQFLEIELSPTTSATTAPYALASATLPYEAAPALPYGAVDASYGAPSPPYGVTTVYDPSASAPASASAYANPHALAVEGAILNE